MKRLKKGLILLVSTIFLFTLSLPPGYAQTDESTKDQFTPKKEPVNFKAQHTYTTAAIKSAEEEAEISKEEAIEISKKSVDIPDDFVQEQVRFHANWGGTEQVWRVSWRKQTQKYHEIEVTINAHTGSVVEIHFFKEPENDRVVFPPKTDFQEAVKIAEKYIEKHYPEKSENLKLDETAMEEYENDPYYKERGGYYIQFFQRINGVQFPENSISFRITGDGEIENHHYRMRDHIQFEEVIDLIDEETAQKMVEDELEMELRYIHQPYYEDSTSDEAYLAYVPVNTSQRYFSYPLQIIDANSGKWIDHTGEKPSNDGIELPEGPVSEDAVPSKEYNQELTQDQAYQIIKEHFSLPESIILEHVEYEQQWNRNETPVWAFFLRDKKDSPMMMWHVTVNAETGDILRFYKDMHNYPGSNDNVTVNVSKQQALMKAIEFVKNTSPDKVDQLYPTIPTEHYYNEETQPRTYGIYFIRKHNGIPVDHQGVNIEISASTGEVTQYNMEWKYLEFPSIANAMDSKKAKDIYFTEVDVELQYMVPYPDKPKQRKELAGEKKNAMLIYRTIHPPYYKFLDAVTGKWRHKETGKQIGVKKEISDIKGHWAEQEINMLVEYNLMEVEDGKFNPSKSLTRGELVQLLIKALGDDYYYGDRIKLPFEDIEKESKYYKALLQAVERNIVITKEKKFHPNDEATREYFAVLMVRALGYDKLANQGVFTIDYLDENQITYKGHVGLIQGLGIMQGSYNRFMPKSSLTKAEAAVALYKFLEKKSELYDKRYR
ncbi:YcdB/YcdC domain-containing protein [Pseudalkalibacillus salsuginis]|uniref:YcdB/YcdC domain-containing protein n=1 Tax=Pseudalkalibacillus salsuginis TaxID=2910972 RepID=UPI001F3FF7F6|nr:YcdB/YcdC domain-containing protein [Pseudalkalibacillus salsuginis]MCF6410103.1 S-layer homology domain-containing protein [Pseudalkalibacillus salsuginis]